MTETTTTGLSGTNADKAGQPAELLNTVSGESEKVVIPVFEEHLHIDTQLIETGVVRITKRVTEFIETVDLPTTREEVTVDRVAVYQYVETPPAVRYEGNTTIFPVLREVLVTEKKLLLVEEVYVTKRQTTDQDTQKFTLRKEDVTVERSTPNDERPV